MSPSPALHYVLNPLLSVNALFIGTRAKREELENRDNWSLISLNIEYLVFVVYSIEFRLNII